MELQCSFVWVKRMDYNKYLGVLKATLSIEVSKTFSLSNLDAPGRLTMEPAFH